jgi:signal transduction histidine kinase
MAKSELGNLEKVSVLLKDHTNDLANFLTYDSNGKHIPAYLGEVVSHSSKLKEEILENLKSLINNVEHIKEVVNSQRLYTNNKPKDIINLSTVIENSILINKAGLEYHKIDVIREFEDFGNISIDEQRVLQILVSIIDNAQQALAESSNDPKLLTVRTKKAGEKIKIEISDNGIGIKQEDLGKIFSNGFTTKPTGHGFGLHNCKMAAVNMRGDMSVDSAGSNKGATFTLELPLSNLEVQNVYGK